MAEEGKEQRTDGEPQPDGDGSSQSPDALEAALRDRFGEDGLDKFNEFVTREEGWLKSHNESQESLAEANRQAQATRDQLLHQVDPLKHLQHLEVPVP